MKKLGIIFAVIGGVSLILSKSGIFVKEIRRGLGLYQEITEITYPLFLGGITLLATGILIIFLGGKKTK